MGSASFPLNFPIIAGSPSPLNNIAKAAQEIAKQVNISAGEVRALVTSYDGLTKSGLSTTQALSALSKGNDTLTPGMNRLAKELLGVDVGFKAATAGAQRFGNTIRSNVVAPVTAASGAIRVLEGSQSIRVVENLLAKTLGLGPAFQAAFPIFGAIAMTEMIGQMVEKVGKLYNAWDPVVRAQERALSSMKELNAEFGKLSGDSQKRIYDDIENRTGAAGGRANRLRAEARDAAKDAVYQDASRIQTIQSQIAATQKRITAGTVHGSVIAPGTRLTRDAQAAQVDLQRFDAELENARLKQKDDLLRAKDFTGEAAKVDQSKAKQAAEGRLRIEKEIETVLEHSAELRGKARYQDFGRVGELLARRETMGRDYDRQLNDLGAEQKINPQFKPEYDKKRAAIGQARKDDAAALNAELLKAVSDQADKEAKSGSGFTRQLAEGRASMVRLQGERASAIDIATGRLESGSTAGIDKAAKDREAGIRASFQTEIQPLRDISSRLAKEPRSDDRTLQLREQVSKPFTAAVGKTNEALFKSETQRRLELAGVEKTTADQNRSLEDSLRRMREEDDKRSAETNTRLQTTLATAGMTGVQKITTTAAGDLRGAAQSRDAQLRDLGPIDKTHGIDEFRRNTEDAARISYEYKEKERQIGAQMLEQIDQERQRSANSHASTLTAGIFAAATHSGEQFGRGHGRSIGETLLTNFGKNFIFQRGGPFDKIQGTVDPGSFLGKIGLGKAGLLREESPLVKPANGLNEAAANLNIAAAKQLEAAGGAKSDTTSGFGANIPGYSTFGSGTHGLTGPGSIVSAVKNIFTGTRKYARPGVSGGGTQPIAPASIEADTQALSLNVAASKDLTSAVLAQTKAYEYGVSGGAAGEMPGGAAPPLVTGPTGAPVASTAATTSAAVGAQGAITGTIGAAGKAIDTLGSDIKNLTGSSGPSGGLGAIGAAVAGFGALTGAVTTIAKATGLGVGRGLHGGSSGGGGSDGNGAGIIVQQSPATNGYSNVFNPDTGRFDVQTPSGTVIPGTGGKTGGLGGFIGTASKAVGGFAGLMANPFGGLVTPDASKMDPNVAYGPGQAGGKVPTKGIGAMGVAAAGADIALGAFTAVSQFKKGGARGALGGASAILGTAAALTAGIPIVGEVLGLAALGTTLAKSIFGDTKEIRRKQIEKTLFTNQYLAPEAQNITSSTRGTFADIGRDGNIRQSLLSPYARTTSAYLDVPFRTVIPGTQSSQFGGGGPVTINIHALDSQSLEGYLKKNPNALMEGFAHGLSFGHSPATSKIKGIIGQG